MSFKFMSNYGQFSHFDEQNESFPSAPNDIKGCKSGSACAEIFQISFRSFYVCLRGTLCRGNEKIVRLISFQIVPSSPQLKSTLFG
jgi:hypothetical protein